MITSVGSVLIFVIGAVLSIDDVESRKLMVVEVEDRVMHTAGSLNETIGREPEKRALCQTFISSATSLSIAEIL